MSGLVKNEQLKSILKNDFNACEEQIRELKGLIELSILAPTKTSEKDNIRH